MGVVLGLFGLRGRASGALGTVLALVLTGGSPTEVHGQTAAPTVFLHGICSSSRVWDPVLDRLRSERGATYGTRIVRLYFDGVAVHRADAGVLDPAIDPTLRQVRLFTVDFFNPDAGRLNGFNPDRVMDQPVEYKTRELKEIIARIKQLTGASKVTLVGHSMGAIAARAYVQNRGWVSYGDDVSSVITLDAPHRGSEWAHVNVSVDGCQSGTSVVKTQMEVESQNPFLQGLNSSPLPAAVRFVSVASWTRFPNSATPDSLRPAGDGIVTLWSQTLKTGAYAYNNNVTSIENIISANSCSSVGFPLPPSGGTCELHTNLFRFPKTVELVTALLDERVPCVSGTSTTLIGGTVPVHATGSVIKRAGDGTVWVLRAWDEHGISLHRDGIPTADRLVNLYANGSKWFSDVITVSEQEFAQYPVGGTLAAIGPIFSGLMRQPGTLIKYGAEISIISDAGRRHPFTSGDNFMRMGYSFCQAREVQMTEYYSYPIGTNADSRSMFFQ